MSRVDLTKKTNGHIAIHITQNVAIFRQFGFWQDTNRVYQYVPSQGYGFVVVTLPGVAVLGDVLVAWAIFRPCALSLSWDYTRRVDQHDLDLGVATDWYNLHNRKWEHVRGKRVTT